jgi:ABC-type sulfate transport system permease component
MQPVAIPPAYVGLAMNMTLNRTTALPMVFQSLDPVPRVSARPMQPVAIPPAYVGLAMNMTLNQTTAS